MFTLAHMKQLSLLVAFLLSIPAFAVAQAGSHKDSSISMTLVIPSYAFQVPFVDLKNRFGVNSNIGMNVIYKHKARWFLEAQGCLIFGSNVEQPGLFSNLVTSQGDIIGTDGKFADVRVFERGYCITVGGGKIWSASRPNPNCGFFVSAGAGYIRHKIKIEDKTDVVPAIQDDYAKGYDRMTSGFCLRQSVGYIFISNRKLFNFYVAVEGVEGFTKERRTINFDEEKGNTSSRTDVLLGFRIGWVLPIFKAAPEKYYLY